MKEDEMRSIVIFGDRDDDLLEQINSLSGWRLEKVNDGGHPYCLCKDDAEIRLAVIAPNVLRTTNVLPHDMTGDQGAATRALQDLSGELDAAQIRNEITASGKDLD